MARSDPMAEPSMDLKGAVAKPAFRADIEGLRAVAILLVVLFHAGVPGFSGGYVGVDVFFVISGFLITGLLVNEVESSGRLGWMEFYARRARRLMPVSALVLLGTLAVSWLVYSPIELTRIARSAASVALYASNILFAAKATNYMGAAAETDPFLQTWSLGVEEQFYFLWPAFILTVLVLARRRMSSRVVLASLGVVVVTSLALCIVLTSRVQPWAFFLTPARFWEFAIGGIVAVAAIRPRSHVLATLLAGGGLVLILGSAVVFDFATSFPGLYATVPVLGTAALLAAGAAERPTRVTHLLGTGPLRWVGQRSYSWYLLHWPLLVLLAAVAPSPSMLSRLGAVIVALGLSVAAYRWVEDPVRRSDWLKARPRASVGLGLSLALLSLAAASVSFLLASNAMRSGEQLQLARAAGDVASIDADGCLASFNDTEPRGDCVYGDVDSATTVVLFGDSHAAHWFPAMEEASLRNGWRLVVMAKAACPSADVPAFYREQVGRSYTECVEWRDAAFDQIAEQDPGLVVISNAVGHVSGDPSREHPVSDSDWSAGMDSTLRRFADDGVAVAVIADVPESKVDVPICLSRSAASRLATQDCSVGLDRPAIRQIERDAVARSSGAALIDMNDLICPVGRCDPVRDGAVMYRDENHLTASFSQSLGGVLGDRLTAATARR